MKIFVVYIFIGVISLAAYSTMAADNDDHFPMCQAVQIANGGSKLRQCLDFNPPFYKGSNSDDEVPAELVPCSKQRLNQLWILSLEGYIRSLGNLCLVYDPFANNKKYVNVKDCDKSPQEAKKWKVLIDGTIKHIYSNQVLTASFAIPHPLVDIETNTYAPSQRWEITPK